MPASPKYPLPSYLTGTTNQHDYDKWLDQKSWSILQKDRRRKRACAINATRRMYKQEIHDEVVKGALTDPFTGEALRWDLIHKWDPKIRVI
jgi:hypothetical protein